MFTMNSLADIDRSVYGETGISVEGNTSGSGGAWSVTVALPDNRNNGNNNGRQNGNNNGWTNGNNNGWTNGNNNGWNNGNNNGNKNRRIYAKHVRNHTRNGVEGHWVTLSNNRSGFVPGRCNGDHRVFNIHRGTLYSSNGPPNGYWVSMNSHDGVNSGFIRD